MFINALYLEVLNLISFKKSIKVWIDTDETQIFSKLAVNGSEISRIQCIMQPEGTLLIGDILPFRKKKDYCKGYGSLMMAELLKYASQIGIHIIRGNLSLVDSDHKSRLHAFYKKHGFDIIQYVSPDSLFYGEVIKKL